MAEIDADKECCMFINICVDKGGRCETCKRKPKPKGSFYEPVEIPYYPYYPYWPYVWTNPPNTWYYTVAVNRSG